MVAYHSLPLPEEMPKLSVTVQQNNGKKGTAVAESSTSIRSKKYVHVDLRHDRVLNMHDECVPILHLYLNLPRMKECKL